MNYQYLIVSDLHLCNIENNKDGWKRYKSSKYMIDKQFGKLLDKYKDYPTKLVFNGDVIDFDLITGAPKKGEAEYKVTRFERGKIMKPTEERSLWKLQQVLKDQKPFFKTVVKFLVSNNHKLIYVLGNHDREFYFKSLKRYFLDYMDNIAKELNEILEKGQIVFEDWFYYKKGEVYIEHGHQYDYYTSYRHQLKPTIKTKYGEELALPMGNLANRYLVTSMGYFNPHATDYILNAFKYAWHWLYYYAFSKRSLVYNWIIGSILVMLKMVSNRKKQRKIPHLYDEFLKKEGKNRKMPYLKIRELHRLHQLPIAYNRFRMIKEFWLDRLFLMFLFIGGTITLALVPVSLWIKLMIPLSSFPLFFFFYELITQGETIFSIEEKIPNYAKKISNILDFKVITFGHSHHPRMFPIKKGVTFADTGTWAPVYNSNSPDKLQSGLQNYLYLKFDGENHTEYLGSWLTEEPIDTTKKDKKNREKEDKNLTKELKKDLKGKDIINITQKIEEKKGKIKKENGN